MRMENGSVPGPLLFPESQRGETNTTETGMALCRVHTSAHLCPLIDTSPLNRPAFLNFKIHDLFPEKLTEV